VPVGIVTDRDVVVEVVAADLDARNLKVGDLVTRQLVTAAEHETCEDCVRVMAMNGVRRMPVVDASGALVGVVTIDDLLPHFAAPLAQLSELAARGRRREMELRR
jgi:CBS domain-containing protein